jgi:hypothetical protein
VVRTTGSLQNIGGIFAIQIDETTARVSNGFSMNLGLDVEENEVGYVALEFALAMGLLVLPTALILLQIPGYPEKLDRTKALASQIAQACATQASNVSEGDSIADITAIAEMGASSTLVNAQLTDASCSFESASLEPEPE